MGVGFFVLILGGLVFMGGYEGYVGKLVLVFGKSIVFF